MENTVMWPTQLECDIHAAHDGKVGCKTVECTTNLGPVHTNPFFKRERSCFAPFSKRFASTLIVFVSFSPVHTTAPYPFLKRFYTLSAHAQIN